MLVFAADWLDAINYDLNIHQTLIEVTFQIDFNCFRSCARAHQLEEHVKWTVPLSLEHIASPVMMKNCLLIDPFLPAFSRLHIATRSQ